MAPWAGSEPRAGMVKEAGGCGCRRLVASAWPLEGLWNLKYTSNVSQFSHHETNGPWMSPALVWWWQNVNYPSVQDTKERVTLYTSIGKTGGAGILLQSLTLWRFWQVQRGSPGRQNLERGNLRENIADACLEECCSSPGCTLELPKALKCRSCLDAVTQTRDLIISDSDVSGYTFLNAPDCAWFFSDISNL